MPSFPEQLDVYFNIASASIGQARIDSLRDDKLVVGRYSVANIINLLCGDDGKFVGYGLSKLYELILLAKTIVTIQHKLV